MREESARRIVAAILVLFVSLGLAYALTTPTMEAPDEIHHYDYIRSLVKTGQPPVLEAGGGRNFGHHAPLYYAVGALGSFWVGEEDLEAWVARENPFFGYRFWDVGEDNKNFYSRSGDDHFGASNAWLGIRVVRILSLLMGALTLWVAYRTGREVFPSRPEMAVGAVGLAAFIPEFLFISGAVNDDNGAALCGSLALWAMTRILREGPSLRRCIGLGLALGLGWLSKLTVAALVPIAGFGLALAAVRNRSWKHLLRWGLVTFGVAALLIVPWMARQTVLYGDPAGMTRVATEWGERQQPATLDDLGPDLYWLRTSFWGRLGNAQIPLSHWIYDLLDAVTALGLLGLVYLVVRRPRFSLLAPRPSQFATLVLAFLSMLGPMVVRRLLRPLPNFGRYLFPVLPSIVLLLFTGLAAWLPRRVHRHLAVGVTVGMLALGVAGLFCFLAPAYASPEPLTDEEVAAIPSRLEARFGGVMWLLGYELEPEVVEPGEQIEVTLYWEAIAPAERDYAVFVHLLGEGELVVAQRDTYPGLGKLSTKWLEPGFRWADRYVLWVPETAYAPELLQAAVGLYDLTTGARLAAMGPAEEGLGDHVSLGRVKIRARPGDVPNPIRVDFGSEMALVGYDLDRRVVRPGDELRLTLYWQGLREMDANYTVSVQLVDSQQRKAAQEDSWPQEGRASTVDWETGQVVASARALRIYPDALPGEYDLRVMVYLMEEGELEHLPVVPEGGQMASEHVVLTRVRVAMQPE